MNVCAVNFYPLPSSFTDTIRVSVEYNVFSFAEIDLTSVGGSAKDTMKGMGLGLKWGHPFQGFEFLYSSLNNSYVSGVDSTFRETSIDMESFKVRYYIPLISDISSLLSFFVSIGQYSSNYTISTYTEDDGSTDYLERYQTGVIGDIGFVIGYKLNKEWDIYLSPYYQVTTNDDITNAIGVESSDPIIKFKGAFLSFGTSIKI